MNHRGQLLRLPPNRVWRTYPGGRTLDELSGTGFPARDSHLAEDWIASTTVAKNPPEAHSPPRAGISQVLVGHDSTPHDFAALLDRDPEYFLGAAHVAKYGASPQLLVKFLDSGTRLHFQVHPTREFAQRLLGAPSGKTEAYHVLSVRASAPPPPRLSPLASRPAGRGSDRLHLRRLPTPAHARATPRLHRHPKPRRDRSLLR